MGVPLSPLTALPKASVKYKNKAKAPVRHIAIDSTGSKVFTGGEWKIKKHGALLMLVIVKLFQHY